MPVIAPASPMGARQTANRVLNVNCIIHDASATVQVIGVRKWDEMGEGYT